MLMMLVQLMVQLTIACITLALRLAAMLAQLFGFVLGTIITFLWSRWRQRSASHVPLRAPQEIGGDTYEAPPATKPAAKPPTFVARPMRPRPRR